MALAHDIANAFNGEIGVGYDWGGSATFYPTGGCDVGPYIDETGLTPAAADARAGHRALQVGALRLTGGERYTVLEFHGSGAAPLVTLTGPGGTSLTTPTDGRAELEQNGTAAVIPDPTSHTTFIEFAPRTGDYAVTLQAGSAPVISVTRANSLAQPSVTATVTGHGSRRTLHWGPPRSPGRPSRSPRRGRPGPS